LLIAALVALAARRLRLPYTVGLVLTGIGLAFAHVASGAALTRELIYQAFLPPLLFEAALNIPQRELRRDAVPVLLLAVFSVVVTAFVVAFGMARGAGWPWPSALVFGTLIAATDPVAVIALFKDNGVGGRLRLLLESESLLNDGVAAVLFTLTVAYAADGPSALHVGTTVATLARQVLGGVACGLLTGGLAIRLIGRTQDHLVETTLTTVAAYGSFFLAESFGGSGVLATLSTGLLMGNLGILCEDDASRFSERGREVIVAFWDFAAFAANSLIFLLIGLRVAAIPFRALGVSALILAVALTLAGRALSVYPLLACFARSRLRVPAAEQHILVWGGLRGALALALALSLPRTLPLRDAIVIATFGVVAFSVVVQGITMPALLKRLNLLPPPPD